MAEIHQLIPKNHYGCRPGQTTTDALHYVVVTAKDAWWSSNEMAILFLDIKGVFPSVILDHLIHDMRSRGIPEEYTEWIKWKVEARHTTVCFNDFNTAAIEILWGLDQGCPLLGISYQFYNTGVIEVVNQQKGEDCVGFVDDTTIIAEGANLQEACNKLTSIMTRPGEVLEWAKDHEYHFALDKFRLMGLTRKRKPDPTRTRKTHPKTHPSITLGQHTIKPTATHKFLGILIDQELHFKEHINYALAKGSKYLMQYWWLAKSTKGITAKHMWKYYLTVAVPKMLYAADIFLVPATKTKQGHQRTHQQASQNSKAGGPIHNESNDNYSKWHTGHPWKPPTIPPPHIQTYT